MDSWLPLACRILFGGLCKILQNWWDHSSKPDVDLDPHTWIKLNITIEWNWDLESVRSLPTRSGERWGRGSAGTDQQVEKETADTTDQSSLDISKKYWYLLSWREKPTFRRSKGSILMIDLNDQNDLNDLRTKINK